MWRPSPCGSSDTKTWKNKLLPRWQKVTKEELNKWKCCIQYARKIGKLSSGHRTGKGQFSFQSQRKAMPKNAQTTARLHSSHMLVKECSKFSKPGFSNMWTVNFLMFKLVLEKARGTRDQIAKICWIMEKAREFQKNIYFCSIDYAKAFDCMDHNILCKILREMGIPDHLTCLLRNIFAGQEATVRTRHGTMDWFQIGMENIKAVYCHPAYLTSI